MFLVITNVEIVRFQTDDALLSMKPYFVGHKFLCYFTGTDSVRDKGAID